MRLIVGAAALVQTGVTIAAGDLGDPVAVADACQGVETVVCTATSMPAAGGDALQRVDHDGVLGLIAAAEQAGVHRYLGFDVAQAKARIYGDGTAGISYVSAVDVAAFAVAAAIAPGALRDVVQIGGPEPITQLGAVATFERALGRSFAVEHVPMGALEAQHQSPDPLQKTFAALMMSCALGDSIPEARQNAARYGVPLSSVADYAAGFQR